MSVSIRGGGVSRRATVPAAVVITRGIRLSAALWTDYEAIAANPVFTRDGRVPRIQTARILELMQDPVRIEIVDSRGSVHAQGVFVAPWATSTGSMLHLSTTAAPGIVVLRDGYVTPEWRVRLVSESGAAMSGTFGLRGADADFVWGLPTFVEGQTATLLPSKISTGAASGAGAPESVSRSKKKTTLFCDAGIAGPEA